MWRSIITLAIFCTVSIVYSNACMCMKMHPQHHYCNSDFVILAKVVRILESNSSITYKVRIKDEYKMTEKALVALKSGKIHAPGHESICDPPPLVAKNTYVLSGRIYSLQAHMTFCDMFINKVDLTKRQKKGFKLLYKHGCSCSVQSCPRNRCARERSLDKCYWNVPCQDKEGICLRNKNNRCVWRTTQTLRKCTKEYTHHFPMIRVKGLLNKRKTFLPNPSLDLEKMTEDPRLVLSTTKNQTDQYLEP